MKLWERVSSLDRPVRIAYFGDSFIEADILTGDLREMLQKRFGGCGVGYVPITTKISRFPPYGTPFVWVDGAVTPLRIPPIFDRSRQDISNHYFIPSSGAYVSLKGEKRFLSHIDTCEVSTCYFLTFRFFAVGCICQWRRGTAIFCGWKRRVAVCVCERTYRLCALESGAAELCSFVLCRDDGSASRCGSR